MNTTSKRATVTRKPIAKHRDRPSRRTLPPLFQIMAIVCTLTGCF